MWILRALFSPTYLTFHILIIWKKYIFYSLFRCFRFRVVELSNLHVESYCSIPRVYVIGGSIAIRLLRADH